MKEGAIDLEGNVGPVYVSFCAAHCPDDSAVRLLAQEGLSAAMIWSPGLRGVLTLSVPVGWIGMQQSASVFAG